MAILAVLKKTYFTTRTKSSVTALWFNYPFILEV